MRTHRLRIAGLACTAVAIAFLCWSYFPRPQRDERTISAAEDEVYAAVVRDMLEPNDGQVHVSQLVFLDMVTTELATGAATKSCEESVRKSRLQGDVPPFNSIADKVYRFLIGGGDEGSLRADTIQDFVQKSCIGGRLSQTFHTDLPRTFIAGNSLHFKDWPIEKDESKSFEQLFPEAGGIISFSHVGFDSALDEAIVSTSFVCGGLCGTGSRYVLRKRWGRWQVVSKWIVWVS